jgi:hypothetical protein
MCKPQLKNSVTPANDRDKTYVKIQDTTRRLLKYKISIQADVSSSLNSKLLCLR